MNYSASFHTSTRDEPSCIVALHGSLGSGRQWAPLIAALGHRHRVLAPDISGYGAGTLAVHAPATLASEVEFLGSQLASLPGAVHLVGHSYGGAIAFRIATASRFATRVRSLTLIEPILPDILIEEAQDRHLYEQFATLANRICKTLWGGDTTAALDHFLTFWNGRQASAGLSPQARLRLERCADKLAFDFTAAFAEAGVREAARRFIAPALLFSGGRSPLVTQRMAARLASTIANAREIHVPSAGHMLAVTHAAELIPDIADHIADADERAARAAKAPACAPQFALSS
ncbi:alpha/beta hydrolase [Bradyrhizobium sp. LHD-71]|uniref:alpha/beta fold hydrolase n=1 Tax=Bradyrhizobium sp. LHD-71 TaxID=3072141 RepID=UPI00280CBEE9|nr:alpha/beta hydrolase [Bradyrhizobium sp. LHD-71]MDQ8727089.1 alpha/beta hydrolase [Bradyrhizobium sp. LHD-71]